jgi:hypothetical protein
MIEIRKSVQRFVKRKPGPKTAAIFALCLQSFHEFGAEALSIPLPPDSISRISPTPELYELQWFTTSYSDRWSSEFDAIEWSYETLNGQTIEVLAANPMYNPFATLGPKARLLARNSIHTFGKDGQEVELKNLVLAFPLNPEFDRDASVLSEEIRLMEPLLNRRMVESKGFLLWQKGLLDVVAAEKEAQIYQLDTTIQQFNVPVFAFSSNPSEIYVQLASHLMDSPVPEALSDIEVLNSFMSWGSRTAMFDHFISFGQKEYQFRFCCVKPFQFRPPIRIEFLVVPGYESSYSRLLDMVIASFILNPDLL